MCSLIWRAVRCQVDQRTMRNFIAGLGQHYPCKLCRAHLKLKLMDPELGPVRVERWGREP